MKLALFFFTLVLAQAGTNQPSGHSPKATAAETAIRSLLAAQVEAWNRGDLEGFMNGYWRSPDLTFFSGGNISQGWQAALERYQHNYHGTGKEMGKLEFELITVDVLAPGAAIVKGRWKLTMSDGKTPHGLFTLILKKMNEGWRIVHDHTSAGE